MKRSFSQRGVALVLATILNAAAGWALTQQPAAGRGSFDLDTAGAARVEALASSAQPPVGVSGKFDHLPAGKRAAAPRPQDPTSDGGAGSPGLPSRV